MKTIKNISYVLLLISATMNAQDLKISKRASVELTKSSKSGSYGGTFIVGDAIKVIYVSSTKAEGAHVEQYDLSFADEASSVEDKFIDKDQASSDFPWYMPKSEVEKISSSEGKWLKAGRAFGSGMKLKRGRMIKHYTLGVYTGMSFDEEESIKPKTGDIWRVTPGGFKSLSDIDALATEYGFYRDLEKYGNPLFMPADATLIASGVITEKVRLTKDQEFSSNRVAVLAMNGMNFDEMQYDIYHLPYTALTVASGLGQDDNLCSLFAPLNGPTTIKTLKHLLWKDRKDHFTLMRFNDQRKLVDSVSFKSKLLWGDYTILNGKESTYVLGRGKEGFDGWYRNFQLKKITAFQVAKVKDGEIQYLSLFTEEELISKLVGASGEKTKFKVTAFYNNFEEVMDLPNGDSMVIGHNYLEAYAIQISPKGDLKAFYLLPVGKDGKLGIQNYQYMIKGDDLIWVINLQPVEFSTDAVVTTSSSSFSGGGVKTTITTTTVKKLNEVFLESRVCRINTKEQKMSNIIALDGREFYPMGSFPAMFTTNAVYFTGREKGPKGKVIHTVRIDL